MNEYERQVAAKRLHFNTTLLEALEGRKIQKAFYMSEDERDELNWGTCGIVLVLDDGTRVRMCSDWRDRGPGSLHVTTPRTGTKIFGPI